MLTAPVVAEMIIFGYSWGHPLAILALGSSKALAYYFTTQTICYSSWSAAALIETFGVLSANSPFNQSSDFKAFLNAFASLLVLAQIIQVLPSNLMGRWILWTLGLATIVPYFANTWTIYVMDNAIVQNHPIAELMDTARLEFGETLHRQSRTYTAACEEYRRRYKIEPPPGFEEWYQFATAHQSPIIDDFDAIYNSIRPLLKLSGKEINENINNARNLSGNDLWSCTFFGSSRTTKCSHDFRVLDRDIQHSFDTLLQHIPATIPNITFLVNHLDEPRVIPPPPRNAHNSLSIKELSRQPTWDTISSPCTYQANKTQTQTQTPSQDPKLPFITDPILAQNLCLHSEYSTMHGIFLSPTSFRPIQGLLPILSTGSLSTMTDILYPSPAYLQPEFQYTPGKDIPWAQKRNTLYWAGSTTGAFATNNNPGNNNHWHNFHRQRFVSLVTNPAHHQHTYTYLHQNKNKNKNKPQESKSSFLNKRLYSVSFTRIFNCETRSCRAQRRYFHPHSWADKNKGLQSKLVFDLDGNGISGGFIVC
ncbi:F-actin-capping protein subunit beta [Aspergillus brasiliensis]|nr:F-actin-capping protein subunit beta [Aspergillus brasiliensis]